MIIPRQFRIYGSLVLILAAAMLLAACGDDATATPRPAPTATTAPAATAVPAATDVPAATAVPAPTAVPAATAMTTGFPKAGVGGVPASVGKLTLAVDAWSWERWNPVSLEGVAYLQDYINVFMLMRDVDHSIVSGLFTEWSLDDTGFEFTIHPDAMWQTGRPITVEDLKWNVEAQRGDYTPDFKGHLSATRIKDQIDTVEAYDDKHGKFVTFFPVPDFLAFYSGTGFHQVHFGDSEYLQEYGVDYFEDNPSGGGPYTVNLFKPGERLVLDRWDDFWGDTAWYHKPQHESVEIIVSADEAARFGLLKSEQVDAVVNIPYAVADDLVRSENFKERGINPEQGNLWTQTIRGTGNYHITYVNLDHPSILGHPSDSTDGPSTEDIPPFDDIRVREAMELAVDKVSISKNAHYGFSEPLAGLWFKGSFGYDPELEVSPYDPERAQQLLNEAGYEDGFSTDIYYGPFSNSPGIKEWLEAAASYWKAVGIDVNLFEIHFSEFYARCCFGGPEELERAYRPLIVNTWGRQEHASVMVNYGYHETGSYMIQWDDTTEDLWQISQSTTDETKLMAALDGLRDYVTVENRWVMPMAEVSVVQGYTDRVLAHPTAPHSAVWEQLWRVVLRD